MSAYPIVLEGTTIVAVVVGGGAVATRKARALVEAGAEVRVVAPDVCEPLERLASSASSVVHVIRAPFDASHLDGATLVFAATNDSAVNAAVARLARERGLPVNVADAPDAGTFVTPAVHRAGDVVVAVSAGRVPAAAARIRDAIALSVDERYASAVRELATLRRALIGAGRRARWQDASAALVGADFREQVESGTLAPRIDEWR